MLPLLSLGKDTAKLNPKLNTSPIARKINLVGQTKLIIRRDVKDNKSYIKESREIQIFLIDKLDHKPIIDRIPTNTQKRTLHRIYSMEIVEIMVLKIGEKEEAI